MSGEFQGPREEEVQNFGTETPAVPDTPQPLPEFAPRDPEEEAPERPSRLKNFLSSTRQFFSREGRIGQNLGRFTSFIKEQGSKAKAKAAELRSRIVPSREDEADATEDGEARPGVAERVRSRAREAIDNHAPLTQEEQEKLESLKEALKVYATAPADTLGVYASELDTMDLEVAEDGSINPETAAKLIQLYLAGKIDEQHARFSEVQTYLQQDKRFGEQGENSLEAVQDYLRLKNKEENARFQTAHEIWGRLKTAKSERDARRLSEEMSEANPDIVKMWGVAAKFNEQSNGQNLADINEAQLNGWKSNFDNQPMDALGPQVYQVVAMYMYGKMSPADFREYAPILENQGWNVDELVEIGRQFQPGVLARARKGATEAWSNRPRPIDSARSQLNRIKERRSALRERQERQQQLKDFLGDHGYSRIYDQEIIEAAREKISAGNIAEVEVHELVSVLLYATETGLSEEQVGTVMAYIENDLSPMPAYELEDGVSTPLSEILKEYFDLAGEPEGIAEPGPGFRERMSEKWQNRPHPLDAARAKSREIKERREQSAAEAEAKRVRTEQLKTFLESKGVSAIHDAELSARITAALEDESQNLDQFSPQDLAAYLLFAKDRPSGESRQRILDEIAAKTDGQDQFKYEIDGQEITFREMTAEYFDLTETGPSLRQRLGEAMRKPGEKSEAFVERIQGNAKRSLEQSLADFMEGIESQEVKEAIEKYHAGETEVHSILDEWRRNFVSGADEIGHEQVVALLLTDRIGYNRRLQDYWKANELPNKLMADIVKYKNRKFRVGLWEGDKKGKWFNATLFAVLQSANPYKVPVNRYGERQIYGEVKGEFDFEGVRERLKRTIFVQEGAMKRAAYFPGVVLLSLGGPLVAAARIGFATSSFAIEQGAKIATKGEARSFDELLDYWEANRDRGQNAVKILKRASEHAAKIADSKFGEQARLAGEGLSDAARVVLLANLLDLLAGDQIRNLAQGQGSEAAGTPAFETASGDEAGTALPLEQGIDQTADAGAADELTPSLRTPVPGEATSLEDLEGMGFQSGIDEAAAEGAAEAASGAEATVDDVRETLRGLEGSGAATDAASNAAEGTAQAAAEATTNVIVEAGDYPWSYYANQLRSMNLSADNPTVNALKNIHQHFGLFETGAQVGQEGTFLSDAVIRNIDQAMEAAMNNGASNELQELLLRLGPNTSQEVLRQIDPADVQKLIEAAANNNLQ